MTHSTIYDSLKGLRVVKFSVKIPEERKVLLKDVLKMFADELVLLERPGGLEQRTAIENFRRKIVDRFNDK